MMEAASDSIFALCLTVGGANPPTISTANYVEGAMKTVLLVDDEPSMLEAISDMFTSHGWDVVTSRNGTDAAARVGERAFDLVLADVVMEGLVGDALLYQIRASPAGADTRTIFMSNMPEARVRSIIDGDYEFVRKPFSFDQLMRGVGGTTGDGGSKGPPLPSPGQPTRGYPGP